MKYRLQIYFDSLYLPMQNFDTSIYEHTLPLRNYNLLKLQSMLPDYASSQVTASLDDWF